MAREHGSLGKLAKKYRKFKQIAGQMAEAQQMIDGDDPELRELAEMELPQLRDRTRAALERAVGADGRRRGRESLAADHGNSGRHGRRRGGPVCPRPV